MVIKSNEVEVQTFGCQNCGHPFKAYPPDSTFKKALLTPCTETEDLEPNHNYKQGYDCDNCNNRNYLFWCQDHFYFATSD